MKTTAIVFLTLILCGSVNAQQQYVIRYDVAAEDIRYLKVKKPGDTIATSVIHLSQTNRINLQLINIAGSYSRQIILHEKVETPEAIIIPGIGTTALQNLPEGLLKMDFKNIKPEDLFKITVSDNKSNNLDLEEQKMAMFAFTNSYNNFYTSYSKWEKAVFFEQECEQLWKDLAGLRYSTQYSAPELKRTARVKTQTVFPEVTDNANALLLKKGVVSPQSVQVELQKNHKTVVSNYAAVTGMGIQSTEAEVLMKQIEEKMNLVKTMGSTNASPATDALLIRIADLYSKIMGDSYSQLTALPVNRKTMMAEIQFVPKIDSVTSAATGISAADTITKWVMIYKKEPLRFRNSVGFSFVSFAENRWNYYVASDSCIAREGGDYYQPVIVTYLHFYSPKDRGFRWGGSFGAGLPLTGDDKQLNILLGLSTFFGKNDPVCITAGVAAAKVKKLSGVTVGEKVSSTNYTINYQNVYRAGYFISLSFNPSALSNRD
ncbi:MAG: hypothetical protein ABL872_03065 [Lacibacter sp.]